MPNRHDDAPEDARRHHWRQPAFTRVLVAAFFLGGGGCLLLGRSLGDSLMGGLAACVFVLFTERRRQRLLRDLRGDGPPR